MSSEIKSIESCLEKLANGNLSFNVDPAILKKSNDAGKMARLIQAILEDQRRKSTALVKLAKGDIAESIAEKSSGDELSKSINQAFLVIKSLKTDAEAVTVKIENGDTTAEVSSDRFPGAYNSIACAMNKSKETLLDSLKDAKRVVRALSVNDLTLRASTDCNGKFREFADDINLVCERLVNIQNAMFKVSKGDISDREVYQKVGKRSENDELVPAIISMTDSIGRLIAEASNINDQCSKGKLFGVRGNTEGLEGGFKTIIEGFNNALDLIANASGASISVLKSMAVNDYTKKVPEDFEGDCKFLADTINTVQSRLVSAQNVAMKISNGDISELENFRKVGRRSDNDQLVPSFTRMMESIQTLIDETNAIADAASEGNLDYRSDTATLNGEYANILNSFNVAFGSMREPLTEISGVLENAANGNHQFVAGTYNGVFGSLANDVNATITNIKTVAGQVTLALSQIEKGNLNTERVRKFKGEWNAVSIALNSINDKLNGLVSNIMSATEQVAAGSSQVATGSQALSEGATEQASSLEELTASITEIAAHTRLNAQNATQASTLAQTAKSNAERGNSDMKEMLASMRDINESSHNISKIIKVIDDIAFQTNILALNAAVEAARAGQHGKGFAVVAEEVRNLAARSAGAANETTTLIENSISLVQTGTKIADNTAKALDSIVDGVEKMVSIVDNIASASNEQATGIAQINQGVSQVSKVVQTNSATSEQSAAASEELSGQANLLRECVSKFTLKAAGSEDGTD